MESLQNPKESIITAKETGESALFQWDSICYIVSLLLVKRDRRSSRLGTNHSTHGLISIVRYLVVVAQVKTDSHIS